MKKFRFLDDGLAGDVYYDETKEPRSTAIMATGFPAFPGPNEFITSLVSSGLVVVHPHCRGTFDSDGQFTPGSIAQTYVQLNQLLTASSLTNAVSLAAFKLPGPPILSVGHSFGCLIALRTCHSIPSLRGLVLAAPALHYRPEYGLKEDGKQHYAEVGRAWPRTYRLGPPTEWAAIFEGRDPLPASNVAHPSLLKVAVVVGEKDKYFDLIALGQHVRAIVTSYVGSNADQTFTVVPGAGHPISELVRNSEQFDIGAVARELILP
jgi:hypothetical protein